MFIIFLIFILKLIKKNIKLCINQYEKYNKIIYKTKKNK